jgi:hypothetical protein
MTQLATMTWSLELSLHYAILKRFSHQVFLFDDPPNLLFGWWASHLWINTFLLDVPNWDNIKIY